MRADAACPPVGIYSSAIACGIFSRRYYGYEVCCDLLLIFYSATSLSGVGMKGKEEEEEEGVEQTT